jgi:protein-S-isoprenylcysteine O-methyltransferase Ste14
MKSIFFKLAGLPILLVFVNLGFLLWSKDVFSQIQTLLPIVLLNAFICADIVIRPISRRKDEYNRIVVLISFLLLPIGLIFPYFEYKILMKQILPPPISIMVMVFGIGFLLVGGILLLVSRLQIGKYGGPKISIEENHRLITTGMYQHIRHPIYLGFLLLFFGYSSALGSIVTTIGITLILFLIFKSRMEMEEDFLLVSFGEEYLTYLKRTKRLLPFLY